MGSQTHIITSVCTTHTRNRSWHLGQASCRDQSQLQAEQKDLSCPSFLPLSPHDALCSLCSACELWRCFIASYNSVKVLTGQTCMSLGRRPYPIWLYHRLGKIWWRVGGRERQIRGERICHVRSKTERLKQHLFPDVFSILHFPPTPCFTSHFHPLYLFIPATFTWNVTYMH